MILNIKGLVVKNHSEQPRTIRIERDRRGRRHGRRHPARRVGRDHQPRPHLCTLTDDVPFVVEMTVENGRGYRTADEGTPRTARSA